VALYRKFREKAAPRGQTIVDIDLDAIGKTAVRPGSATQVVEACHRAAYSKRMSRPSQAEDGIAPTATTPDCPRCRKPMPLCVCETVKPIESRLDLLILQHPQEQDRALGTARLTAMHFERAILKVGLSWPSLSKALGRTVADPSRWAVLYLGSAKAADLDTTEEVVALNRKGEIAEHQRAILRGIEGVVLLDGTWSQAKALWWRNAWMLKCQRLILGPLHPSRYGKLRREPRHDGLSTIEAAALVLSHLEKRPDIAEVLNASFARMLEKYREVQNEHPLLAPKPPPKRDFRRRKRA
jgi:DTW domain-containing protein